MSTNADFLQSHLDRVSRSFAFCIRQLPDPLREWVAVSYLLCRIVDTIEDSEFSSRPLQVQAFTWFDQALTELSSQAGTYDFPQEWVPKDLTLGEAELLKDSQKVFQIYWSTEASVRKVISELALSMSQGMKHFRLRTAGPLRLKDLREVNQYCFFVAGLVGEMLVHFVSKVEPRFELDLPKLLKAHHFGLFLQKVNLLKDQIKDQKLGRFLVPSRSLVEQSAHENANQAIEFLAQVPMEQMEFRRFCAWSLFLGLESLKTQKISRQRTEHILTEVEERLHDNGQLKQLFQVGIANLEWGGGAFKTQVPKEDQGSEWISKLYHGRLKIQSFRDLGIA